MIYRTLNEIRTIDPSLRTLKFNRSLREAGWSGQQQMAGESDENGGAIAVILLAVVVALLVGVVWLTR